MSRRTILSLVAMLAVAGALSPSTWAATSKSPKPREPGGGQTSVAVTVTGAGAGTFGSGASFGGVPLSGLQFGMGMDSATNGPASGDFQSALLGTAAGLPRTIAVEGKVISGSVQSGIASFSGTSRIDMGDGTPALLGVPFTVVITPGADNLGTLRLTLGTTTLPLATANQGRITVR